ncbi:MAG TPA: hypothetical protein V6C78_31705 [Crinalium sp.]
MASLLNLLGRVCAFTPLNMSNRSHCPSYSSTVAWSGGDRPVTHTHLEI